MNTLWNVVDQITTSQLTLQAGNDMAYSSDSGITAGETRGGEFTAGADLTQSTPTVFWVWVTVTLNPNNPITMAGGPIFAAGGPGHRD